MTVKEAILGLICDKLECGFVDCNECMLNSLDDYEDCSSASVDCAKVLKAWLESLPEGRLSEVTIEDLL